MAQMMQFTRICLGALLLVWNLAPAGTVPVWELESSGNRVLLMGSIHYLRQTDYPLPDSLMRAYDQADVLVMEIDMDSLNQLDAAAMLTDMGTFTDGSTLRSSMSSAGYTEASQRAQSLGIPLEMFSQFKPWFVALTVTQMRMMQLGFDPAWGIETQLTGKAAEDEKSIDGLETLREQLSFMADLDADAQESFLLQSLEDAATIEAQVSEMVSAWRNGDAAGLEQLMLEGFEESPELEQALLITRNRNWVSQIANLRNQPDDYLVVVGAMHLVGDNSVLAMLERRGIKSRQLTDSDLR